MKISKTTIALAAVAVLGACSKAEDAPAKPAEPAAKSIAPEKAPAPEKAITVDRVLADHVNALGGAELLRNMKSISYKATETRDDGTVMTKTIQRARPGLLRVDFKDGDKVGTKAFDGQKGWVEKEGKAEILPDDKVAGMKAYAQFDDVLLDPKAFGAKAELLGEKALAGGKAHELRVTLADGTVETRYLDAATHLEVQRVVTYEHDGKKVEKTLTFGDYKQVAGQMINHSMTWSADGKGGKVVFSDFQVDQPLDAKLFAVPAGATLMVEKPGDKKTK